MEKVLGTITVFGFILLAFMGVQESKGGQAIETQFVTLVSPRDNLVECKLPAGSVVGELKLGWDGLQREVYFVPEESALRLGTECRAGDRILNHTIGDGR